MNYDKLKMAIEEIISVLERNGESEWSKCFREIHDKDITYEDKCNMYYKLFGGMGSLNDLVLQNANGPTIDNARFDGLRNRLYQICSDVVR